MTHKETKNIDEGTMHARSACVTGAAGFIGFHLSELLLKSGWRVVGIDSMSDYYDVRVKDARLEILKKYPAFTFYKQDLSEYDGLLKILSDEKPDELVHLAAQAGVRYSLVNPWAYASSNYLGTLNVFEAAKALALSRVVYASSSSVYGANTKSPFSEDDRVDQPISLYAASKKANEVLAYSYHHLYKMEMVGLRFFTVYGRWGRPDMALFKFARRIVSGQPIEVYNNGQMKRSFTHVTDIVSAIKTLVEQKPSARYELYNLGGAEAVPLMRFVELIEQNVGTKAEVKFLPLQAGDVPETIADCSKAERELGYVPRMTVEEGIKDFMEWYKENQEFLDTLSEPKQ
jgi:UDP-glucuronate 4-epimerase